MIACNWLITPLEMVDLLRRADAQPQISEAVSVGLIDRPARELLIRLIVYLAANGVELPDEFSDAIHHLTDSNQETPCSDS
jgi:hypothetical protein